MELLGRANVEIALIDSVTDQFIEDMHQPFNI